MPHDAEITNQTVMLKEHHGGHDMVLVEKYEAPASADGGIAPDEFRERDFSIARNMMTWLRREYPGYPWNAVSDLAQGIVKFNIPIMMGINNYWLINLRTHPDIIREMARGAGQILERYRLSRQRFILDEFLDAREKHSALVIPTRKVPT